MLNRKITQNDIDDAINWVLSDNPTVVEWMVRGFHDRVFDRDA